MFRNDAALIITYAHKSPESEIQAKLFADFGETCGEILAKTFANFRPSICRKNDRMKRHKSNSCTTFTSHETNSFTVRLWKPGRAYHRRAADLLWGRSQACISKSLSLGTLWLLLIGRSSLRSAVRRIREFSGMSEI